ncbi:flagellar export chaperone FliS [Anaerosporobacter sp.]|uniref:flagellar export chaperone FliS n=1 Tax=Anaerosporobacter sp. TaxID=1872529 RepID=UPI00286EDA87|nr:flagellar export chaperone FliS [Anaerosporobacter sp.]
MAFNYAATYQNNKIQTASKGELTLILYDAGVKFVNMAILALEKDDMEGANKNIKKAEDVITEFRSTLDHKYPVANDFDLVYDYMYRRLIEANIKKDKEILEAVLVDFKEMRDVWKQVMKQAR